MLQIPNAMKSTLHQSWGWIAALGAMMMMFGGFIVTSPLKLFTTSLTVELLIGLGFVMSGGLRIWHGVENRRSKSGLWHIAIGLFFAVGGLFLLSHPAAGLVSLVAFIAALLAADGIATVIFGLSLKGQKGRLWIFASAGCSLIVAFILFSDLPHSASWALGLFVGAAFLLEGLSFLLLGLQARKIANTPSQTLLLE